MHEKSICMVLFNRLVVSLLGLGNVHSAYSKFKVHKIVMLLRLFSTEIKTFLGKYL